MAHLLVADLSVVHRRNGSCQSMAQTALYMYAPLSLQLRVWSAWRASVLLRCNSSGRWGCGKAMCCTARWRSS
eukprot:9803330-Prorocentrum_lima.AAC.1